MKKLSLLILPILIGLTACSDKPVFVQNGFFCNGAEEGKPTTDIKLYKNYAIITTNGTVIKQYMIMTHYYIQFRIRMQIIN